MADQIPTLHELLRKIDEVGGSDLHLKVGSPPAYRINGLLTPAEIPSLRPSDTEGLLRDLLPEYLASRTERGGDLDFAYGKAGLGRFRVASYRQRGSVNIVVRSVPPTTMTLSELGLPAPVAKACEDQRGLILVTGPVGSGKTTTCAGMIDHINSSRKASIITIEDPIEVLHRDKMSLISQREVGVDVDSFESGMRAVLRQDPDVIYVGELRSEESIELALIAAETGQLVIATMYTIDAVETVHRILDSFPPYQERRVRQMLATTLRAIISQRLIPRANNDGRTVVAEILVSTEEIQQRLIEPEQTDSIREVIAEGGFYGMQTIDQAITASYVAGDITFQDGLMNVVSPRQFKVASGIGSLRP